jgi:hypothetical protein
MKLISNKKFSRFMIVDDNDNVLGIDELIPGHWTAKNSLYTKDISWIAKIYDNTGYNTIAKAKLDHDTLRCYDTIAVGFNSLVELRYMYPELFI